MDLHLATRPSPTTATHYRAATLDDVDQLLAVETACFTHDQLSRRSFRRWIKVRHGLLIVAEQEQQLVGYGLVWCHKGTRLARLYSLAVLPTMRGQGVARDLLLQLEDATIAMARLYIRLEVAQNNTAAIKLYESLGYRVFGQYNDYYEDHSDALRMQKTIQKFSKDLQLRSTPWYRQTTEFSCGPAALMMAMASLSDDTMALPQTLEIDLWREATTVYMTSGLGGCHPIGLALAARRRGYEACVFLNTDQPLFLAGVRSAHKKHIMDIVHRQFLQQAQELGVEIIYQDIGQQQLEDYFRADWGLLTLISTYRLDGKKSPHWVTVTGVDETCFYLHDPDFDNPARLAIDCQFLPILRQDFNKMTAFGSNRLRSTVAIRRNKAPVTAHLLPS